MKPFPHQLVVTLDPFCQDQRSIGFYYEGVAITDPFTTSCGRSIIEPFEYDLDYEQVQELQQFNEAVTIATDKAIEVATENLNQLLLRGGHAPQSGFFKGSSIERNAIWGSLAAYLVAAINASQIQRKAAHRPSSLALLAGARIGEYGIAFEATRRAPWPNVNGWWNARALPRGQICVIVKSQVAEVAVQWVESSQMEIHILDLDGKPLAKYVVDGRAGLNGLYEALVGYRPDEESFEPDGMKLLARVCEMVYRHTTGDAS